MWEFGFFGIIIYLLPTIIALIRRSRNSTAIVLLNIFLGWTIVGWIIALIWAFRE